MSEIDVLRARVSQLEGMLADSQAVIPSEWRLTPTEERVLRVLLAVDRASRDLLNEGAGLTGKRAADVHILRIRRKTARFGVVIDTIHDRGWSLIGRFTWARGLSPQAAA